MLPPLTLAATDPGSLRDRASEVRLHESQLATHERGALLELYATRSALGGARVRLASLEAERARVRAEQASARRRLGAAHATLRVAYGQLAGQLRLLYEQGGTASPVEVVLGASSLQELVDGLDALTQTASASRELIAETRLARMRASTLAADLRLRRERADALAARAAATASALARAADDRLALLRELRASRAAAGAEVAALEARAAQVETTAVRLAARAPAPAPAEAATAAAPAPVPAPDGPAAAGSLTVSSTGYALSGTTATGLPVGWGVAAVDPSVIPLGTRLYVPGYGEAVAADVGPAVRGAEIDLWFPSTGQALAWGRRSVTITLG